MVSLLKRYPPVTSAFDIVGNLGFDDYSSLPRHKQTFSNIAGTNPSFFSMPDYSIRMLPAPSYFQLAGRLGEYF